MSFDLKITFAGMCLLVNDADGKLRVLLPPTGGHHGPHAEDQDIPVHAARLIFDPTLKNPGAESKPVDVPASEHVHLEGMEIDLSGLRTNSGFNPTMPKEVVDLAQATQQPVSRSLFHGDTGGRVLTRITLDDGAAGKPLGGGRWRLGRGVAQHMATAVEWLIKDVDGDFLDLDITRLGGGAPPQTTTPPPKLYPSRDGTLRLYVFHSPEPDLPTRLPPTYRTTLDPREPRTATHFDAYYDLIDLVGERPPVPAYEGDLKAKPGGTEEIKGLKITCITATARVD